MKPEDREIELMVSAIEELSAEEKLKYIEDILVESFGQGEITFPAAMLAALRIIDVNYDISHKKYLEETKKESRKACIN